MRSVPLEEIGIFLFYGLVLPAGKISEAELELGVGTMGSIFLSDASALGAEYLLEEVVA